MLLARFRVSLAAFERLKVLLTAPLIPRNGTETKLAADAPPYGDDAALLSTEAMVEPSSSPEKCKESTSRWTSSGAAKPAERELRIVLWALRDAAACVVQEETRRYARRRRTLLSAGFGPQEGTASKMGRAGMEEATDREDEDEDGYGGGYQAEAGKPPLKAGARVSTTADTTTTTTASSSKRVSTAREITTAGTATATSSAVRRGMGCSGSSDLYPLSVSTLPATDRSPLTAASVFSPSWQYPHNAGTSLGNYHENSATTGLRWSPEVDWEVVRGLSAEEKNLGSRVVSKMAKKWLLLPSEEHKKRCVGFSQQ